MESLVLTALLVIVLALAGWWALRRRARCQRQACLEQLVGEIGCTAADVDRQVALLRERVVQGAQGLPNALAYRDKLQDIEQLATRVLGYSERARALLAATGSGTARDMEMTHRLLQGSLKRVEHLRALVEAEVSLLLLPRPYRRKPQRD